MERINDEPGVSQLPEGETGIHTPGWQQHRVEPPNRGDGGASEVVGYTSCPDAHVGRYVGTLKLSHISLDCFCAVSQDCLPFHVSL